MTKVKRLLLGGSLLGLLFTSLGGCYYSVRGPYPLVTFHRPGEYRDRDCRYDRNC